MNSIFLIIETKLKSKNTSLTNGKLNNDFARGDSRVSSTDLNSKISSTIFLFITGVAFAYYVVCPIIFSFFINSAPDSIVVMTDISQYLNFVLKVTFAFGVAFEMPVATYLIIRSGIAKKEKLKKARPYLIVLFFILGMLLTPPDVFSQLFLAIPMWLLFELGLLISKDKI